MSQSYGSYDTCGGQCGGAGISDRSNCYGGNSVLSNKPPRSYVGSVSSGCDYRERASRNRFEQPSCSTKVHKTSSLSTSETKTCNRVGPLTYDYGEHLLGTNPTHSSAYIGAYNAVMQSYVGSGLACRKWPQDNNSYQHPVVKYHSL